MYRRKVPPPTSVGSVPRAREWCGCSRARTSLNPSLRKAPRRVGLTAGTSVDG